MAAVALALALMLVPLSPWVLADDSAALAEREARLEALRADIARLGETLEAERERAGGLEAELARLERRIGGERTALADLDAQIRANAAAVAELTAQVARQDEQAMHHRRFLAATLRSAYRRGHTGSLQLLLGETDPARLQRLLVYQRHIGQARAEQLQAARAALQSLQTQRTRLQTALERQAADRAERAKRLAALQASLGEREAVLDRLEASINEGDRALASRREEAAGLTALIDELEARLARRETAAPPSIPLTDARGQLAWPLEGPLLARYGTQRAGDLTWTGLLIGAESGTPVHPIAPGQVVFADWLRGLGLLLIIDHGNGYLSLYGRNQALYFAVGERVTPRDTIATVGRTGGRREAALYFELRADGKPIDPLAWLQAADTQS